MTTTSAAKKDSFAAAESIAEGRHEYAETKFIRIAASREDIASPLRKIAAKQGKLAAPDLWIEAMEEFPERPLRYGGARGLHLAP